MRPLWAVAALLLLGSGVSYLAYRAEVRTLEDLASRLRGPRSLSPEQLLVGFCGFAHRTIANPTFSQLPPLVRVYYLLNPTHPGPGDVLRWGSDYRGGCGSHSSVVVALLRASGVPSRPLFLTEARGKSIHTVVEAHIDGRWVVADPTYDLVYRRPDGALATVGEIVADEPAFRRLTATAPGYNPEFRYDHVTLLNWHKVPIVLPALHDALAAVLGRTTVDAWTRPDVWMWPREMLALVCLAAAGLLAGAALWLERAAPAPVTLSAPAAHAHAAR